MKGKMRNRKALNWVAPTHCGVEGVRSRRGKSEGWGGRGIMKGGRVGGVEAEGAESVGENQRGLSRRGR
jgi:hypothetical protein